MVGTLDDLQTQVAEYCSHYRHPDMGNFTSGPLYDLFPEDQEGAFGAESQWSETWPSNGQAGIYAFLTADGRVIYIGKSSMKSSVSARLSSYCQYGSDKKM